MTLRSRDFESTTGYRGLARTSAKELGTEEDNQLGHFDLFLPILRDFECACNEFVMSHPLHTRLPEMMGIRFLPKMPHAR